MWRGWSRHYCEPLRPPDKPGVTLFIFIPISKGDLLKVAPFTGKCMVQGGKRAHIKLFTAVNWVIASQKMHLCGDVRERKDWMKRVSMLPRWHREPSYVLPWLREKRNFDVGKGD